MGKNIWLLILLAVFLTACNVGNAEKNTGESDTEQKKPENDSEPLGHEDEKEKKLSDENAVEKDEPEVSEPENKEKAYKINDETSSVIPLNEKVSEKVALLTIDDAPHTYSLEMAKTLKRMNANAIFFVNGHFLDTPEEKEILKQIHNMGFMIGNHTFDHAFLPDLSKQEQKEQIVSLSDKVEEIIGERPVFFRAPNGANTEYSKQVARENGMVVMNWTYGYDYFKPYMNAEKLTEAMVTGKGPEVGVGYSLLKPGANLLMHDREWTATALDDIINGLRESGYSIVDPKLIKTIQ
ncbi:polysaccharide deacetylase family protein [Virgibacillus kekensis]|uniref:Polysaccharide deacetylase family protein n=1 Tax=Virgibacillus kekensis TaxID=202261 RepID=A0ABV9DDS7_9BACI